MHLTKKIIYKPTELELNILNSLSFSSAKLWNIANYEKKNYNYGDSFGKLYEDLGPIAGLVPLHNKLDRATSLVKGNTNHFESLEDTLRDLASYAIMNIIEIELQIRPETKSTFEPPAQCQWEAPLATKKEYSHEQSSYLWH